MTFSEILERISHSIAAAKISLFALGFSDFFALSRIAVEFQRRIIDAKFYLSKLSKRLIFVFAQALQESEIDNMSEFVCQNAPIFAHFAE